MSVWGDSSSINLSAIESNELVRRALGGCADSFTELARRYRPRLLSLLSHRPGLLYTDAEDIVQDTLSRAFLQLERFDPQYRFSTWLFTIAVRLASDHAKSRRRMPQHVSLDGVDAVVSAADGHELTERQDLAGNIWKTAHSVLSDSQYTAMWLRYAEEMSAAEVARVMQKTQIGVRVLLHRSRAILMAELSRQEATNEDTTRRPRGDN
jgi:RNA polymerase sigma-70 factor (ECF subfamily)